MPHSLPLCAASAGSCLTAACGSVAPCHAGTSPSWSSTHGRRQSPRLRPPQTPTAHPRPPGALTQVYAVDLSPAPLAYAAFNAQRLGVGARLATLRGSWYEPLEEAGVCQLAGIVSNPPYIPSREMPGLQAEVGRWAVHARRPQREAGGGQQAECTLLVAVGTRAGAKTGRGDGFASRQAHKEPGAAERLPLWPCLKLTSTVASSACLAPSHTGRAPPPRLPRPPFSRHEPHLALHGGEGLGIDCLLPICTGAARMLQPGGFLALETAGGEQAHYIADMLRHMRTSVCGAAQPGAAGGASDSGSGSEGEGCSLAADEAPAFCDVRVRRDLRGVDRFVTASRCR